MSLYLPSRAEWAAFFRGVREFRCTFTTAYDDFELADAYDCGREFAHWVTFRRFER